MSVGDIWQHRKGGLYREVERRSCRSDLQEGQFVLLEGLPPCAIPGFTAILTDDINAGEEVVLYVNEDGTKLWARPARLFDDGGFTRVAGASAPIVLELGAGEAVWDGGDG